MLVVTNNYSASPTVNAAQSSMILDIWDDDWSVINSHNVQSELTISLINAPVRSSPLWERPSLLASCPTVKTITDTKFHPLINLNIV